MNELLHVLLIEDVPAKAGRVKKELAAALPDAVFHIAAGEAELRSALAGVRPGLIVSASHMSRFDGLSALKTVRSLTPYTPFIMLAGSVNLDEAVACLKAGADDYLARERISGLGRAAAEAIEKKRAEKETADAHRRLIERGNNLQLLVDNLSEVVWKMDLDLDFTWVSHSIYRLTGYTPEEWIGTNISEHVTQQSSMRKFIKALEAAKKARRPGTRHFEIGIRKKNGDVITAAFNCSLLLNTNNRPAGIQGSARDITDRKVVEAELVYQATLLDNISDAVISTDADFFVVTWNRAAERLYGCSPYDAVGRLMDEVVPTRYVNTTRDEMLAQLRETGSWEGELVQTHRSGEDRAVWSSVSALYGAADALTGATLVNRDITRQKEMERELRVSEERYRITIDAIDEGLYDWDIPGNKLHLTDSYWRMLGYEPGERENSFESYMSVLHPDDRELSRQALTDFISGNAETTEIDMRYRTKSGDYIWARSSGSVVARDENGKSLRMTGTVINIDRRKRAEEQVQKDLREREILIKEIHHRVKNNLQIMSSLLSLQMARVDQPDVIKILRNSRDRIRTMSLIHDVMYRAQNYASIDMEPYLLQLTAAVSQSCGSGKNIELHQHIAEVVLTLNQAIPCALIINELLTNAFKHAFETETEGRIDLRLSREHDHCILIVSDTGIGMDSRTPETYEQGLGLQIVSDLVNQLDGTIAVRTQKGAAITVRFPIDEQGA